MVGNGTVATFQQIGSEDFHPVVSPPLGPPVREPNLSMDVYALVQLITVTTKRKEEEMFLFKFQIKLKG